MYTFVNRFTHIHRGLYIFCSHQKSNNQSNRVRLRHVQPTEMDRWWDERYSVPVFTRGQMWKLSQHAFRRGSTKGKPTLWRYGSNNNRPSHVNGQTATVSFHCFLCCWNRHCSQFQQFLIPSNRVKVASSRGEWLYGFGFSPVIC